MKIILISLLLFLSFTNFSKVSECSEASAVFDTSESKEQFAKDISSSIYAAWKKWQDGLLAGLCLALVGYTRWQLLILAAVIGGLSRFLTGLRLMLRMQQEI